MKQDPGTHRATYRASQLGLLANAGLAIIKGAAGIATGSIAVISDAVNSATDVVASVAIYISVRASRRGPDADHPFGHQRAEPMAAFIVAVFTCIVGFEIARASVRRLLGKPVEIEGSFGLWVLAISIVVKLLMAVHFRRVGQRADSPAIRASAVDCRNDVLASSLAFLGVLGAGLGWGQMDAAAGIFIAAWVVWSGYRIGAENIDFLMGRSPGKGLLEEMRYRALAVTGVRDLNDVKAHYVGNQIHVEIHIEVDRELSTQASHDIGTEVREQLCRMREVAEAFVHVDPV